MRLGLVLRSVLLGVPVGVTLCDCVGYVARVEGVSMRPALNPEEGDVDYVFLNRWAARAHEVRRGEVVSLVSPRNPDQKIIKRVTGVAGDVVGRRRPVRVPGGHCWVEGDHVGHSLDSNSFGPVSLGLVTAKATHVVWPPRRWGRL